MTPEGNWRAALVDRMHEHDVRVKELASDAKVPFKTMTGIMYTDRQPGLYTGLRILKSLGVRTIVEALQWYDTEQEEVVY